MSETGNTVMVARINVTGRGSAPTVEYTGRVKSSNGLVVWPQGHYDAEVHFALDESPTVTPRPRSLSRAAGLTPLPLAAIVFAEHSLDWAEWHAYWETEQNPTAIPRRLLPEVTLLRQG